MKQLVEGYCEAKVVIGDRDIGTFTTVCCAPCPRDKCPFPERVVEGRCGRGGAVDA